MGYAFRRVFYDPKDRKRLWEITKLHFRKEGVPLEGLREQGFLGNMKGIPDDEYNCWAPYNNFHVSRVDFWRAEPWNKYFQTIESEHGFMKFVLGDANVHAMALGL